MPSLPGKMGLLVPNAAQWRHCSSVHADGVHVSVVIMSSGSKNLKTVVNTHCVQ